MKIMLKQVRKISCVCVLLLLCLCIGVFASDNVNKPLEYCFAVNYPELGKYGDINTNSDASTIHGGLDWLGYYNPYYYTNNKESTIISCMPKAAIFYFTGHGESGRFIAPYSLNGKLDEGYVAARNIPLLPKTRCAFFNSCNSALYGSSYGGSLTQSAVNKGALCAIGFKREVYDVQSAYFAGRVLVYYAGSTIGDSCESAKRDTFKKYQALYGNGELAYGGVDSVDIAGNEMTRILPAAYK